ncbi:hypothetical protein O6H91_11G062400 [Diphasiastrum complanatum]|uniref:Uncharacterized protein n=8 Tax=Diphasiastrum complanatum TaxID=34168 RepID=A0ACC2C9M4_DIPCM|nr:hypothetical protein O6H91_11G062400 [Diphasiastrum complanatum]KAJ7538754.1 hypothetical protein O6H91_11G062400 [Diphasiastrum complanatum]KAJ7538755.1 hypothetical protein O6H91_11G062400 [Diphasiastrum complanatum]KAJ7538756.1 hypothetical protein O6H91_11G062400 [Diphasiastrum complanatum]KAJ7538757.1 hypothetical protein O6H91_11G062400 [Diphasiastrum complanatum]
MEGQRQPTHSVMERLSWGSSSEAGKDEIVTTEDGLAGVIFMCNKETKKKCYLHGVFGLPQARQDLVEQVVPRMKLFLFEYESRTLSGIFEAISYGGIDLEPHAFVGHESVFPAQVYFREVTKCMPLLEREFKAAIHQNYYTPVKFNLDLSVDQVKKLIQLFQKVKLPGKGVHDVIGKKCSCVNGGGEFQHRGTKDLPEGRGNKEAHSKYDKTVDNDKTIKAASMVQKRFSHAYDETNVDFGRAHAPLESDSKNDFLKRILESSEIISQNFDPRQSRTSIDGRSSQYSHPSFRDAAFHYAEQPSLDPHDLKYPFVGQKSWSNGMVAATEFGAHLDLSHINKGNDVGIDSLSTIIHGIQGPSASTLMGNLRNASQPFDYRVDSLAPRIQGLNSSYVNSSLPASSSFFDLGADFHSRSDSFNLGNLYPRAGGVTHYDSSQLDRHLSFADDFANEDKTFPHLFQNGAGIASQNRVVEGQSLASELHLNNHQGPDFLVGPRPHLINNESVEVRAWPLDNHYLKLSTASELRHPNSVAPYRSTESGERTIHQNDHPHVFPTNVDSTVLRCNLEAVQNVFAPEATRNSERNALSHNRELSTLRNSERNALSHNREPSTLDGNHNFHISDDYMLQRMYEELREKEELLRQLEKEDDLRNRSSGAPSNSGIHTRNIAPKAHFSRQASAGSDYRFRATESAKVGIKQKQSVWSRLSGLKVDEVDKNSLVKERSTSIEARASYALKGKELTSSPPSQSDIEAFADVAATEDACVDYTEDTFIINFKRRKGRAQTSNEQSSITEVPPVQASSQSEKDTDRSSSVISPNPPNCVPKRRKLIRPDIHDVSEGERLKVQ